MPVGPAEGLGVLCGGGGEESSGRTGGRSSLEHSSLQQVQARSRPALPPARCPDTSCQGSLDPEQLPNP